MSGTVPHVIDVIPDLRFSLRDKFRPGTQEEACVLDLSKQRQMCRSPSASGLVVEAYHDFEFAGA